MSTSTGRIIVNEPEVRRNGGQTGREIYIALVNRMSLNVLPCISGPTGRVPSKADLKPVKSWRGMAHIRELIEGLGDEAYEVVTAWELLHPEQ